MSVVLSSVPTRSRLKPADPKHPSTMTQHLTEALARCRKCHRPGHCKGPNCHRCRSEALEKLAALLFPGLPTDTQHAILWYCHEHPLSTFRTRIANLGPLRMAARSCGPGFVQMLSKGPGRGPGPSYRMVQICRSALRRKRGITRTTGAKFATKAYHNGRCYNVATLTCYGDFVLAISAFLY